MAHKNVIYHVDFSNIRKANLNCSLEAAIANYKFF